MNEQLTMFNGNGGNNDDIFQHPLFKTLKAGVIEKFKTFHADNPHVYNLFLRFTREVVASGRKRYSVQAITERIRWHVEIETRSNDDLKLNNNHRAVYSRLLFLRHPTEFANLFEFRTRNGERFRIDNKNQLEYLERLKFD